MFLANFWSDEDYDDHEDDHLASGVQKSNWRSFFNPYAYMKKGDALDKNNM